MTYTIEKNVPIIAPRDRYPWRDMEVGDSFAVPLAGKKHVTGSDMARVRVQSAAASQTQTHGTRYTIRQLNDEGIVRVWRVA